MRPLLRVILRFTGALLASALLSPAYAEEPAVLNGITEAHNQVRAAHGVEPLRWSEELADYAQQWADHLANDLGCKMRHRPAGGDFGENLYWGGPMRWSDGRTELQPVSAQHVVKVWADEEADYDYASNRCASGKVCGHFTQVVWSGSSKVGCARTLCSDKAQVWVCNYDPPGNYVGMQPY